MDAVDDPNDELTAETPDWKSHPGAKPGPWSLEIPLEELFARQSEDERDAALKSTLTSMLDALRGPSSPDDE